MIRKMNLEIGLEFYVLLEILELSLTKLFIHWKFFCFLGKSLFVFRFYYRSKNIN